MTDKQKLQMAVAKARKELRELALADDSTALAIEEKTTELGNLEAREAALPDDEVVDEKVVDKPDEDAEAREVRALREESRVAHYVAAVLEERPIDGREAELNAALKMSPSTFPLRLLAPEVRATTDAESQKNARPWVQRLFGESAASFLGVTVFSVGPGTVSVPVITAGAAGAQRGRGQAADDAAWTVSVSDLKPTRNVTRAVFAVEDAARLPGVEQALRRDLRMALNDGLDKIVFNGDATADENVADIVGLAAASGVAEETLTQTAKVAAFSILGAFANLVDGKAAAMLGDLRAVVSVSAYQEWLSTNATTTQALTVARFLADAGLPQIRVREGIADNTDAGSFGAFVGRQRGIAGCGVAPIWAPGRIVRDIYTRAKHGEISINITALWSFALPRASNFARIKFVA